VNQDACAPSDHRAIAELRKEYEFLCQLRQRLEGLKDAGEDQDLSGARDGLQNCYDDVERRLSDLARSAARLEARSLNDLCGKAVILLDWAGPSEDEDLVSLLTGTLCSDLLRLLKAN
jgi:hypothetical protein